MDPKIVENERIFVAGMVFYGDPFKDAEGWSSENEIGKLWGRFSSFWDKKGELVKDVVNPDVGYEVHIEPDEYAETGESYVMVGLEVEKVENIPLELSVKVLPASTYALFTLKGEEITSDWATEIYKKWLPQSGYQEAHKFVIECYDGQRFKGTNDPESELDIYVPISR